MCVYIETMIAFGDIIRFAVASMLLSFDNVLCQSHLATPTVSTDYYTAAVFEHSKRGNDTTDQPLDFIKKNLVFYENAAKEAKSQFVDIIIFPEYGIIPWLSREDIKAYLETIPDPRKVQSNPCNDFVEFRNRSILYKLSCIAKQNSLVVVANMGDIQPCSKESNPNCPDDGTFHFNANVAFDRDGTILAKYHKEHLFKEPGMNFPQEAQSPLFTTDFGTFAMYICFDVAYKNIANYARNTEVDAVLLPNMWFDYKPFMASIQFWEAWSTGNNVPFLTANGQMTYDAVVGSGIFLGRRGALVYTYNPDGLSKLVVSQVPKRHHIDLFSANILPSIRVITENGSLPYNVQEDGKVFCQTCTRKLSNTTDSSKRYHCSEENMEVYSFAKLNDTSGSIEVCNNGMCCSLNYIADTMDEDFYMGVFNGTTEADQYGWCTENCFLARCDSFNNSACQTFPMRSNTIFRKVELKANFTTSNVYPSVMKNNGRLMPSEEKSFNVASSASFITASLSFESNSQSLCIFVGLNGRCYDRDPPFPR